MVDWIHGGHVIMRFLVMILFSIDTAVSVGR